MSSNSEHLIKITEYRLNLQKNYEPKLRSLVESRSKQLGFQEQERKNALRSIDALVWKLTAAGIHLERLWENRESLEIRQMMASTISDTPEPKRFTDKEIAYLAVEFEAYLLQARAFISIAQIHTLDACRVPFGGQLTNKKYESLVNDSPDNVKKKLVQAFSYFDQEVFGPKQWGGLLKSLRDRVTHFDRIRPSRDTSHKWLEELTVTGLSLERLAQDFENGSYDLIVNVIAPIWGRDWQPGAYQLGMWD